MTLDRDRLAAIRAAYVQREIVPGISYVETRDLAADLRWLCDRAEEAVRLRDAVDRAAVHARRIGGWDCLNPPVPHIADSTWLRGEVDGLLAALTDALGEADRAAEIDRWVADTQARHRDALTLLAYEEQIERDGCDACRGTGTRRRHISTAACSRCGGTGEATP